jgi:hypothetical protein
MGSLELVDEADEDLIGRVRKGGARPGGCRELAHEVHRLADPPLSRTRAALASAEKALPNWRCSAIPLVWGFE